MCSKQLRKLWFGDGLHDAPPELFTHENRLAINMALLAELGIGFDSTENNEEPLHTLSVPGQLAGVAGVDQLRR